MEFNKPAILSNSSSQNFFSTKNCKGSFSVTHYGPLPNEPRTSTGLRTMGWDHCCKTIAVQRLYLQTRWSSPTVTHCWWCGASALICQVYPPLCEIKVHVSPGRGQAGVRGLRPGDNNKGMWSWFAVCIRIRELWVFMSGQEGKYIRNCN